jgi:rhodanese-related sulfurtransferase
VSVEPAKVKQLVDGGAQVVDVRTAAEHGVSHIEGATHIPIERLGEEAEQLDRDRALIVYCRGGNRSAIAAEALRNSGWDAHSIDGGLVAWKDAGLPIEPDGAEVAPPENLPPR